MTDASPEADQQILRTHQRRFAAVFGAWAAGLATLMVMGPGMDFLPPVVLPIAGAVAGLSAIPIWQLYKDWAVSQAAVLRITDRMEQDKLKKLKGDLAAVPTAPEEARAVASRKLLARIEELAQGDQAVTTAARTADRELVSALADVEMFAAALDADRAADPEGVPNERLQAALATREAEVEELVRAIRDLHAALSLKDDSTGPVLDSLQAVLDKADAEVEVRALGRTERARQSRARSASE